MDVTWKNNKRAAGALAAVILMAVSGAGFTTGLSFGGDWGWLVGGLVWLALTVVQMLGNDEENREDWILTIGWGFTYVLGVGASTWAMYSWILLPQEVDLLRWVIAFGIGGVVEVLPERLIYLYIKSLKKPASPQRQPTPQNQFRVPPSPTSKPQQYQPQHKPTYSPTQQGKKPEPTYRNLFRDDDER